MESGTIRLSLPLKTAADTVIYACGPNPMLKALCKFAKDENIQCFVSLEERMACGIGACLGCVVKTLSGIQRVCKDGPVFDAKEIIWENI